MHMRTTITITEALLEETMKISGKEKYSEAIVTSLRDYIDLKKRLGLLEDLFTHPVPHKLKKIKKQRKQGQWSS